MSYSDYISTSNLADKIPLMSLRSRLGANRSHLPAARIYGSIRFPFDYIACHNSREMFVNQTDQDRILNSE